MNRKWKQNGLKILTGAVFAMALIFMSNMKAEAEELLNVNIEGVIYELEFVEGAGENGADICEATVKGIDSQSTSITIPKKVEYNGETYNVVYMNERAFGTSSAQNTILKDLTIEADVNIMGRSFQNCTVLSNLTITGNGEIGNYLFVGDSIGGNGIQPNENLKSVTITGGNVIKERAFQYCEGITSLVLKGVTLQGIRVFSECTSLETLTLEDVVFVGTNTFIDCTNLQNITIKGKVAQITGGTFEDCENIKNITLPASVKDIGDSAFKGCTGLKTVTIEGTGVALSKFIFENAKNLKTVYVTTEDMKNTVETHFKDACKNSDQDYPENVVVININAQNKEDVIGTTEESIYIPPAWQPTTQEELYAFGLRGSEDPIYTALEGSSPVTMYNEVQGPLCINVMKVAADQFTLARTYSVLINNKYVYHTEDGYMIRLEIPKDFRQVGREFKMICVTKDGAYSVLNDLDQEDETITFKTSDFHAFGLCYQD